MLDFHTPQMSDRQWIQELVEKSGQIGCDVSFVTTYLWREKYDIKVCLHEGVYYKAYFDSGKPIGYCFPIGEKCSKHCTDIILKDAKDRGVTPVIGMMCETNAEILRRNYPDMFEFYPEHADADYIYLQSDLAELSGKKYHAKRNHISKFMRTYEDCETKNLCADNFEDAMKVAQKWMQENPDSDESELDAIREALDNFEQLGLFGTVLYVSNEPVAMTIASLINSSVCDVHFEKAVSADGAYAVINNEFAKSLSGVSHINREEDMGIEGLKKSKLSYNPVIILMKYTARCKK